MASNIKIQQFRVSFIWFETQLSFLDFNLPDTNRIPFSFLGRSISYEMKFQEIKQTPRGKLTLPLPNNEVTTLTLPWKTTSPSAHYFWRYYLGQEKENVTERLAWERFVPFREKESLQIQAAWLTQDEWIELEAFYYPHGVGLVATIHCNLKDNCGLDDMISKAFLVREKGQFDVTNPEKMRGPYRLDYLASKVMNFLHTQTWGNDSSPGFPAFYMGYPFSIFTVIQGEGVSINEPVYTNTDICRRLFAITEWSDTYLADKLPAFEEVHVPIWKRAAPSNVLYGAHGRAVWFPEEFTQKDMAGKLAAYHRNLVLTSLQVESLCSLVFESAKLLHDDNPFTPFQSDCLRRAADCLERLYSGADTYRSYSARRQLEKNKEMLNALNNVRIYWNMDPLPTPQASEVTLSAGNPVV